jgi:SAM-dependent methyltransferase
MTQPEIDPLHEDLIFHGPLSEVRADQLIQSLGPLAGQRVVDLGCGWAELLLRTVATEATATGCGIDQDAVAIEHGRANAQARGLTDRVVLDVGDASAWTGTADVLIVNGATQLWGGDPTQHTANALAESRKLLRPGGRLLLGEGFWLREPTQTQLQAMDNVPLDQYRALPDLVDFTREHGYRLLWLSQASRDEWDEFESRHALGWQRWLLANPDSPHAPAVEARADTYRNRWLRGWRATLGFAYLTLVAR